MADPDTLTHAFLAAHPADAARVLERLSAAEAAALFDRVPARLGAPVLAAMLPSIAARALVMLAPPRAAEVIAALGPQAAVAVLRHIAEPRRTPLLDALPTAAALACRALLGYPEDSIGAWVDPDAATLPPDLRAADAMEQLRRSESALAAEIYVVGPEQRLDGVVALAALLRAPPTASVSALMERPPQTLPAVTPLAAAAGHPAWRLAAVVPVVERGAHFIGVLHRHTLEQVLARDAGGREPVGAASLLGGIAAGYWRAVAGLLQTGISVLPRAGVGSGRDDGR